ncbi:MerR family transcriptional regulator [Pseudooceanicola sp. MF1-13]|uniref:MerR family transcriptional regulator n=1 Tax=Pseudooceanicola sp. MF1-13 TaxID=3379095 RepID=UPI003891565A
MAKSADAFRTISEVSEWLDTPAHVLRFWESKFSQVKPVKRAGGRRYYRPSDMELLGGIKRLLHEDGMTIKGVQKLLREKGVAHVSGMSQPLDAVTAAVRDAMEPKLKDTPADPPAAVAKPDPVEAVPADATPAQPVEPATEPAIAAKVDEPVADAAEDAAEPVEAEEVAATVADTAAEIAAQNDTPADAEIAANTAEPAPTLEAPTTANVEAPKVDTPAEPAAAQATETPAPEARPRPAIKAVEIEHRPTVLSLALARKTPLRPEDQVEVRRLATRLQNWLSRQTA